MTKVELLADLNSLLIGILTSLVVLLVVNVQRLLQMILECMYVSILKNASTNHPELMALTSDEEIIKAHMIDTLQKAWVYLNNKFLENLAASMSG